MKNLISQYADTIMRVSNNILRAKELPAELLLEQEGRLAMYYAPFDYVNTHAKIVLVGITPGFQQAANALIEARRQLLGGASLNHAAQKAKETASFSGSIRPNLIALLDYFRVNEWLGINTCASLFESDSYQVHYTSVLRYPIFKDGKNYTGSPAIVSSPFLLQQAHNYFADEMSALRNVLIVPLGDRVAEAVIHLAREGHIEEEKVLAGIPHPSGANNERISYMLGRKSRESCSAKTDTVKLDIHARQLAEKMSGLLAAGEVAG